MRCRVHLIKAEETQHYRFYIALCIIGQQLPGLLHAGTSLDRTPEASEPAGECLNKTWYPRQAFSWPQHNVVCLH